MKILLVNTYDRGGAANACLRLHGGLIKEGFHSHLLLRDKSKNIPFANVFKPKKTKQSLVKKLFNRYIKTQKKYKSKQSRQDLFLQTRDISLELFSYPNSNFDITQSKSYKEADIINLHWVADFLDYKSFFKKNTKPVVWTIHDMNPFTGGEHYTEKYLGINDEGFPIPRVVSEKEKKEFKKNVNLKLKALKKVKNLHIVTLNNWMYAEAKKSDVFKKFPIHIIPNGIDSSVFKIIDKNYARGSLGLPMDKKIILFVADSIDNSRKGFTYLKKAFEKLGNKNLVLCAIGHLNKEIKVSEKIIELGLIEDENVMCNIYNASDVFVIPSLMDNLPNTVLESLLCGTPVIGFPVGGIPDILIDGENGFISSEISVQSLVNTINKFIKNEHLFDKQIIRQKALKNYALTLQVKSYIQLFNSIQGKKTSF
ncbi:glycosyltransferase [Litoribaculum gwangyangense]|uniref:Glycosyltransferase n=1 Tax=Litoribaculum gwangyangense TaxID=1130722 RepID=A0ABP9CRW9_9FLAO